VVPSAMSRPNEIVVPPSQTAWMLDMPDKVLSTHHAHNDVLYSEYNFLGKAFSDDVFHIRVVHRNLARHLPQLIPDIEEEVNASVEAVFGTDTENWKTFNLWQAWLGIVPRVTNRVLVGKPTCRNETFLKSMEHFADVVVTNSFILNMFPKILHPIVGRLVQIPNSRHWNRAHKVILPVITKRLEDMAKKDAGDPTYDDWAPPEDFITWAIRMAKAEGNGFELSPISLSKRLLPVEFAAIHTTVLTGHFIMMDLLSSDPSKGYLATIQEETSRVLREDGGHWTKAGLARLLRTDSAIRESMRLSNFATSLVKRKVIAKEGITNTTEGWKVPYGGFLMLNLAGVHHDPDLYANPNEYDPWRYSRVRERYEGLPQDEKDFEQANKVNKLGMVTTSDSHLAFGHGRHAW
jgi:cytochrome P450